MYDSSWLNWYSWYQKHVEKWVHSSQMVHSSAKTWYLRCGGTVNKVNKWYHYFQISWYSWCLEYCLKKENVVQLYWKDLVFLVPKTCGKKCRNGTTGFERLGVLYIKSIIEIKNKWYHISWLHQFCCFEKCFVLFF